jgi:hypothetical protein
VGAFAGFLPWIVFWVVCSSPSTWEWGAFGAFVVALLLVVPSWAQGESVKMFNIVSLLFFGVFTILGLFLDASDLKWLDDWSQVISSSALAIAVFGSLLFVPFTEEYARETVDKSLWDSPNFKHTNRVLTAMWGVAFVLMAIFGIVAQGEHHDGGAVYSLFNWILPIAVLVGAFKLNGAYVAKARERGHERAQAAAAGGAPPA